MDLNRGLDTPFRFAFISSNGTPWGGSEELWGQLASRLAARGQSVSAFKRALDPSHPIVRSIREHGGSTHDLGRAIFPVPPRLRGVLGYLTARFDRQSIYLRSRLRALRPDLVVISQAINFDGWRYAALCRELGLRYVLISHKASELYWPDDHELDRIRSVYQSAVRCFFVSEHNRRLTADQLDVDLAAAQIVRNPFNASWDIELPWPSEADGYRVACVGRLNPHEKGQDLLLRVLARPRWRSRPLRVTFCGTGAQRRQLETLAKRLDIASVTFAGQVGSVEEIWRSHHALVLPSRAEGLPLTVVEAMLCARVPIVTPAGGTAEIIDHDRTGFVASAISEDAVDDVLDRAWSRRQEWRGIGEQASSRIRDLVPRDPVEVFAATLLDLTGTVPA